MINEEDELEMIAEVPVMMTQNTCLHIRLFHAKSGFAGIWAQEWVDKRASAEKAANLMIDQLGGYWNAAFLVALRVAITNRLRDHDNKYGTTWAEYDETL